MGTGGLFHPDGWIVFGVFKNGAVFQYKILAGMPEMQLVLRYDIFQPGFSLFYINPVSIGYGSGFKFVFRKTGSGVKNFRRTRTYGKTEACQTGKKQERGSRTAPPVKAGAQTRDSAAEVFVSILRHRRDKNRRPAGVGGNVNDGTAILLYSFGGKRGSYFFVAGQLLNLTEFLPKKIDERIPAVDQNRKMIVWYAPPEGFIKMPPYVFRILLSR